MTNQIEEAWFRRPFLLFQPFVASLVIVLNLVRLMPAHLNGHAVSVVLRLKVLVVADVIPQQHFAVRIHHLIDHRGTHIPVLVPVIQVQFRPVTIPKRVAA